MGVFVNQHSTNVKTIVSTIALSVAMMGAAGATAQTAVKATIPAADTVMLSDRVEGDYQVRRYLIRSLSDVDYSVLYRISVAKLNAALKGNAQALSELNSFVEGLMQDTTRRVCEVIITGYASPDGSVAYNEKLAAQRANDFKAYVDGKYNFSKHYSVTVKSVAEDWKTTHAAIASSSVPDRAMVLGIVDGTQPPMAKEQDLKRNPAVWNYLAEEILPPMRRVEVMIGYATDRVVEERTLIKKPAPAPKPAAPAQDYVVVEEDVNGVIVEMPDKGEVRKAVREETHAVKKDSKAAVRQAKRDARKAAKIARAQEKAAKKIARKEAKAAKKAARATGKTYKELEKM